MFIEEACWPGLSQVSATSVSLAVKVLTERNAELETARKRVSAAQGVGGGCQHWEHFSFSESISFF